MLILGVNQQPTQKVDLQPTQRGSIQCVDPGGSMDNQLREDLQPTQRGSAQSVDCWGESIDNQLREDLHRVLILGGQLTTNSERISSQPREDPQC